MDSGTAGESGADRARLARAKAERLNRFADDLERGVEGEKAVAGMLDRLPAGFIHHDDLDDPGRSKANIDHVVFGPTGAWVVDAKNWDGKLTAGKGHWWRHRYPITSECDSVQGQAERLSVVAGVPVTPVICFVGTQLPAPRATFGTVHVCSLDALLHVVGDGAAVMALEVSADAARRVKHLVRTPPATTVIANRPPAIGYQSPMPATRIVPIDLEDEDLAPFETGGGNRCRRMAARFGRRIGFGALRVVAFLAVAAIAWAVIAAGLRHFTASLSAATATTTAPATNITAVVSAPPEATTTTSAELPYLPPTLQFTCPVVGAGWIVSPAPTEYRTDEHGFNMWWQDSVDSTLWVYWGLFQSGINTPYSFGVHPGQTVNVKMHRGTLLDPHEDPTGTTFTAPVEPC